MSDAAESPGLLATMRRLGTTLSSTVSNRLELLLVELQLERVRFIEILILLLVALALSFLTLLLITAAIVVLLWPTQPVVVLFVIALLYGIAAWLMARRARELLSHEAFSGSLSELKKDQTWLHQTLSPPSNSAVDSSLPKVN